MRKICILLFMNLCVFHTIFSQNDSLSKFKPSGKPILRIYTNYHTTFTSSIDEHRFELTRAYFGYKYDFSSKFSGVITFDVGDSGSEKFDLTAFPKYGYLNFHHENLKVNFGLISTLQFKLQEKMWGYRYIFKSFQDEYKFGPSADFGMSINYEFTNFLSADLSVLNGEGYKVMDVDSIFQYGMGLTVEPIENLFIRAYYDVVSKGVTEHTMAFFAGYKGENFILGGEYNQQLNSGLGDEKDRNGFSFFGSYDLNDNMNIFTRYDNLMSTKIGNSNLPWNIGKDGQLLIGGFEFNPVKGIKVSPNFQGWIPGDNAKKFVSSVYLNLEIRL